MSLTIQNQDEERKAKDRRVLIKYISELYIQASDRLKLAGENQAEADAEQIESDRAYVDKVNLALSKCSSESRMLIRGEYFEPSGECWMYLCFSYSQLDRMRKKALSEFFDKLDL